MSKSDRYIKSEYVREVDRERVAIHNPHAPITSTTVCEDQDCKCKLKVTHMLSLSSVVICDNDKVSESIKLTIDNVAEILYGDFRHDLYQVKRLIHTGSDIAAIELLEEIINKIP